MSTVLEQMRFAPEKAAMTSMIDRFGLEPVLSHFEKEGGLSSMRDMVLGSNLKLSTTLSPRVFRLLDEVRAALDYHDPIDISKIR